MDEYENARREVILEIMGKSKSMPHVALREAAISLCNRRISHSISDHLDRNRMGVAAALCDLKSEGLLSRTGDVWKIAPSENNRLTFAKRVL